MATHSLKRVTEPAVEPVTLAEVKHHLGISPGVVEDDAYLMGLIAACRRMAESRLGETFIATKWRMAAGREIARVGCGCGSSCGRSMSEFPSWAERVPRGPLLVDENHPVQIEYEDEDGRLEAVDDTEVGVSHASGAIWPKTGSWGLGAWVTYWAGVLDPKDVSPQVKAAISMMVTILYSNRGDGTNDGEVGSAWDTVSILLMSEWDGRMYR